MAIAASRLMKRWKNREYPDGWIRTMPVKGGRAALRRLFLSRGLCLRMAAPRGRVFDLCVDLAAQQESKAGHIQPHQQDHDCAQRSISSTVSVEEMQIGPECERCTDPKQDSQD